MKMNGSRNEKDRYIPTIGEPDWDILSMSRTDREVLKDRIVMRMVNTEEEFKAVISYMYEKFWDMMDKNADGMNLQWKYATHRNKTSVKNSVTGKEFDMYGFVMYDKERDMEPIAFGGSYFKEHNLTEGIEEKYILPNGRMVWGHGYVLFVDPHYRRMGLANDQWVAESQLYRDCNVKFQYDIQNTHSLAVTQNMFSDPSKCEIVAQGRLKNDGTRSGIRILMDYTDEDLVKGFKNILENITGDMYKPADWTFLEREGITIEELNKPWEK